MTSYASISTPFIYPAHSALKTPIAITSSRFAVELPHKSQDYLRQNWIYA